MQFIGPYGVPSGSPYVQGDAAANIEGSYLDYHAVTDPMTEIVNVIEAAGLTPDDVDLTQLLQAIRKIGGHNVQVFTTSGTFTAPHDGWYWIETYGAGGGAALYSTKAIGEGGGPGGYGGKWVWLTEGQTVPVTVGAAGTNGTTGSANGTAGGTSSFGSHVSATGGGGATYAGAAGAPGAGSGGDINLSGSWGIDGVTYATAGLGGDAPGPHGGKGARSGAGAAWPGGGGTVIPSGTGTEWSGAPAAGGVIVRY